MRMRVGGGGTVVRERGRGVLGENELSIQLKDAAAGHQSERAGEAARY